MVNCFSQEGEEAQDNRYFLKMLARFQPRESFRGVFQRTDNCDGRAGLKA
jgi:hypothetical protein